MMLTRKHLQSGCVFFAQHCWTRGVRPEEAFSDPTDAAWYTAVLSAMSEVAAAERSDSGA